MIGKCGYSGGNGDNRERCSVLHCDRDCEYADRHVPSCGFRWSAVVWALVVAGVALVASVLVFFLAPSSVFGLPESGATSEETAVPADDDSGSAAGDSEITEVVSPDAVASPDSVSVDALGATLNMPYDGTISGTPTGEPSSITIPNTEIALKGYIFMATVTDQNGDTATGLFLIPVIDLSDLFSLLGGLGGLGNFSF